MRRLTPLAGLALAVAAWLPAARAQEMGMPGMDHHAMPAATHAHGRQEAAPPAAPMHPAGGHAMHGSQAMSHDPAMRHPAQASVAHAMGPMQGGNPPPGARDPDYSEGVRLGPMHGIGMAMEDQARFASLQVDRLEAFHGPNGNGQQWEIQGGVGGSLDKLWLRTEGERSRGRIEGADVELLWRHAVAAFWDTQLGVRTDTGEGPDRQWVAFGIQGLAPYWFELEATGYVGPAGRTAAR
ncbi:MAG TPA: copper resistance protein B, partial [Frateuria sp.]|uniref:copper resistance protein B n=1 Tax=Frateuria sp. TaxID=2211372 RepID=UPI002D7E8F34